MFGAFYPGQAYPAQAPDYPPIIYIDADGPNRNRIWAAADRDTTWRSKARRTTWFIETSETTWR